MGKGEGIISLRCPLFTKWGLAEALSQGLPIIQLSHPDPCQVLVMQEQDDCGGGEGEGGETKGADVGVE